MTEDVTALLEAAPLPPGYRLDVRPQRKFKHRNLWNIRVLDEAGNRLYGRAYYNVAAGIVDAQRWAWLRSDSPELTTVTVDGEGYIRSIEDVV